MMGNKGHRLQPAVQVAQSKEDSAAKTLTEFQRRLAEHQARLQQLVEFRSDYAAQLECTGQNGISARRLQDYIAFLAKLDQSIVQSQQNVQRLQKEFQRRRNLWLMSHARTQALEGVIEKEQQQQERAQERREQIENDERNLRNYRSSAED